MDNNNWLINEEFSFSSFRELNMKKYQEALEAYERNLSDAISIKNLPIFIDTNFLLHPYKISIVAKNKLREFFEVNNSRIFITKQVQKEFLANREKVLDNDFLTVLRTLPSTFDAKVINSINKFINDNKNILGDYGSIQGRLKEIEQECKDLRIDLQKKVYEILNANKNIKFSDEILNTYCEFNFLDNLSSEEINFLEKQFDSLKETKTVFPGKGDIKDKPNNPYGDFIIFHELLKYVKQEQTDVIFLTMDKEKGDWFKHYGQEKKPYIEYIQKSFYLTSKIIYIIDAERALSNVLNVSLEDVVDEKNNLLSTAASLLSSLSDYDFQILVRELVKAELSEVAANTSQIEIIESDSDDFDFMAVVSNSSQSEKTLAISRHCNGLGKVSLSTVKRLHKAVQENHAALGVILTDSYFAKEAHDFAASHHAVVLLDRENLSNLLIKHGYL